MLAQENSPPYVRFEARAIEDGEATRRNGYYVSKDIDIIIITPRGSAGKLVVEEPYDRWLRSVKNTPFRNELRAGDAQTPMSSARFPDEWIEKIEAAYKAWKTGQVLPEDGLPIAQWGVASPAQREQLVRLHIFTVEQLAEATEEALQNFGMGGRALRQRARDYLAATKNDAAKLSGEMAELRRLNESLQNQVKALSSQLEKLNAAQSASNRAVASA
jgi:hypothetical protein